jgi:hypothetical protein
MASFEKQILGILANGILVRIGKSRRIARIAGGKREKGLLTIVRQSNWAGGQSRAPWRIARKIGGV